jgi:hypothetical protein
MKFKDFLKFKKLNNRMYGSSRDPRPLGFAGFYLAAS